MQKRNNLKVVLIASAVAAMFSTAAVQAQSTSAAQSDTSAQTSSTGSMAKLSSGDEKALKDMAQANINEIAAAKIALNKAESSEVKAFAQKMVDDHGDALTKVQTVAKQKDVNRTRNTRPWPTSWKKRAATHSTKCIWKTPVPKITRWSCLNCKVMPKTSKILM